MSCCLPLFQLTSSECVSLKVNQPINSKRPSKQITYSRSFSFLHSEQHQPSFFACPPSSLLAYGVVVVSLWSLLVAVVLVPSPTLPRPESINSPQLELLLGHGTLLQAPSSSTPVASEPDHIAAALISAWKCCRVPLELLSLHQASANFFHIG